MTHEQNRMVKTLCRLIEYRLHDVQLRNYSSQDYKQLLELTIADAQEALGILRAMKITCAKT